MIKFTVPGTLPTLNDIIKSARANKYGSNKNKKNYDDFVAWSCKASKLTKLEAKADFTFTWYMKDKRKDKDNIMAGQKFIFDGLQKAGVLKNDGWGEVGNISHRFEIDKENPRVEVKITRAE